MAKILKWQQRIIDEACNYSLRDLIRALLDVWGADGDEWEAGYLEKLLEERVDELVVKVADLSR